MKFKKIILVLILFNLKMLAQDNTYNGPAKMEVKTFWRQADMFKNGKGSDSNLGNMKKALAGAKEKDPSYNTSAMEEELKKWNEKISGDNAKAIASEEKTKQDRDKKQDLLRSQVKISNSLDELYKFGSLTISGNTDTA